MQATLSSHLCGAVFHTSVCFSIPFSVIPHCLGTPGVLTSPSYGRGSWGSKELGTRVPSQSGPLLTQAAAIRKGLALK